MSRPLSDETIAEILHDDSDTDTEVCGLPGEECSDSETNSNYEEPPTQKSDDIDFISQASSSDSDEEHIAVSSNLNYYGKNRYKWSKNPPAPSRTREHNIIRQRPGLIGPAAVKNKMNTKESFELLIDDNIIEIITNRTNEKITENTATYPHCTNHVSVTEMKAFIGLLLLTGVCKSGREDLESLWATDGTGRDIFRATMSLKRFLFILSNLRFDDITSREERKAVDRAALISEIFHKFIENCQKNYSCSEHITIDEMLCPFRGRCLFRVYMKSKPAKYGIKILCLCDAKTHYLYNAFIYTGKQDRIKGQPSVPTQSVLQLATPVFGSNRNITADNWFSSVELVDALFEKKLTYVGTLRKNKREIPNEFLPHKYRQIGTSLFGFTANKTIVSFVPKRSQSVIMISSMHHDQNTNERSGKPEVIEFYNSTKGGVDSLDQKCANYSVSRRTRRWPSVVFYGLLNIACANGYVLWKGSNPEKKIRRRQYIKSVGIELIKEHIINRKVEYSKHPKELRDKIDRFLGAFNTAPLCSTSQVANPSENVLKRGRCHICDRKKDGKFATKCSNCTKFVCKIHSDTKILCKNCQD